jgi:hypothetical protein
MLYPLSASAGSRVRLVQAWCSLRVRRVTKDNFTRSFANSPFLEVAMLPTDNINDNDRLRLIAWANGGRILCPRVTMILVKHSRPLVYHERHFSTLICLASLSTYPPF